ncbi:MAG: ATP-binding cassette domain-containing protein [Methanomicrobia archaeon]|nr:ATP-binding cassette domain-containing protein [Methanomicrobia archaeon]HDM23290.1 ATP-binding cassette domain-containing protein [Methanomicrobia archaeon]
MIAIETHGLTKEFNGLIAVDNLNLKIKKGELFSLLGPNGAGKTTTIKMLSCLLNPTHGKIRILEYDAVEQPYEVKKVIGVSPQETVISEFLNSWENLELIGRLHRMDKKTIKERSKELLETLGLMERAKDPVHKLSGGMKRRLSLIMALIHDPAILFLDEPTLGLDPQSRRAIWEYIRKFKGEKTILLTTHYMEEADQLSDRIGIIDEGRIVALDTPERLKERYSKKKVVLVEGENIENVKGKYTIDNNRLVIEDGDIKGIVERLSKEGVIIKSIKTEEPTLEEVFIEITGKELRE